uniref:NADH dehydrogenase subunit 4L n=1 Tax=Chalcophora japonica TaxID=2818490 RepID=UPI0020013050|nr:NADH dehydrogenase subunit 4L [Chalcophora japonica]UNQ87653.1 NADH dehydrogenase subunit 4L [Chalcophora japonica]UVV34755.1 NADH dehydrogenase subunit 4L [Chalcophora japonica]WCO87675.1 NADH dehydrogenase subunit 4L [Chalcophora japonica]
MLSFIFDFGLLMFFSGILAFCSKRKHLLLMLLSLEFVVLSLYLLISVIISLQGFEFFFMMVFLTMSVCESALGLSILVSMIRTHGSDYFQSFNILW